MSSNSNLDINQPFSGPGSTKYGGGGGISVPNRIFVGGISPNTSEAELYALFSKYGNVKATKIILDKGGISKGYGFVTFETEEEADTIIKSKQDIILNDRKLNIAAAVKKQSFSRGLGDPAHMISNSTILYPSTLPQSYNGAAGLFTGSDNLYLSQAHYPVIYPQHVYLPQYYPTAASGGHYPTQYVYAVPAASSDIYAYGSAVSHSGAHSNDFEESSASEASSEGGKSTYSKQSASQNNNQSDYELNRMSAAKSGRHSTGSSYRSSNSSSVHNSSSSSISSVSSLPSPHFHQLSSPYLHQPIVHKTVNGVVMAYPSSVMMGTPTILHVRDSGDHDSMTELAFFHHSPLATGALTPPPTPLTPVTCDFGSTSSFDRKN